MLGIIIRVILSHIRYLENNKYSELLHKVSWSNIKGTLMQIWKSANIFVFIWKQYVEGFTLKHLLVFEICAHEICEDEFVYKYSETMEYVEN